MSYEKTDLSGIYMMLEEIKADINKKNNQLPAMKVDAEAINNLASEFRTGIAEMKEPQKVECRHSFDISKSKPFIMFCSMGIISVALSVVLYYQARTIKRLNDNDLKYRYIHMKGRAEPEDILMLHEVFDYDRNADSIHTIRKRIEKYEQLIRQQAETEARARLNAGEAEKIKQEAETIKEYK